MTAMRDVWGEKLVEFGHADPRTVVLDGDLANSTKADKFAKAHPDRFFQMGIAEQNLVGAAAGLASVGFVPWTSSFTVFFTHRALDPIRMLVAQSHANVKIVGSYSGLLIGAVGKTHLDIEDLAIMRAMPDLTVLAPADAVELRAMMDWAQAYDGPVYLRIVRDAVPDLFGADYTFTPGAIHRLRDGGRVSSGLHRPADRTGARGRRAARRVRGRRLGDPRPVHQAHRCVGSGRCRDRRRPRRDRRGTLRLRGTRRFGRRDLDRSRPGPPDRADRGR